ncbi:MAG TPA: D-2-hydroxyacid dehydrogenase [Thermomicrobiales bacterium]|nr:D-2-hydroxyacid dehydrogenase [Thermomicrobiales bacterium]
MGEGCLKSADSSTRPVRRLLIRFDLPPGVFESLQNEFPEILIEQAPDAFRTPMPLGDAEAVVTWALTPEEIDAAPNLRWVQWIGAGVDHAPLDALKARQIQLTNNRGVHANNIAEHIIGMMIAIARRFPRLVHAQDEHHWSLDDDNFAVRELAGSTLLILGAGNIGAALARKAVGLDLSVEVLGRNPRAAFVEGTTYRTIHDLDTVLPSADHVAICIPLTSETNRLFDADRFARMKPGSVVYNVGRGPIVDTSALIAALESGHLAGAGIDVSDPEPLPPDHPLWNAPNVFITGHTSGRTPYYWDRGGRILRANIHHYLAGEPLENLVDFDLGY